MPEATELAAVVRALAARERAAAGDHPTVEELTAYSEGELPGDRADAVLAHVAVCRRCSALLLEYAEFTPQAAGADDRAEVADAYRRVSESLGLPDAPPVESPGRGRHPAPWAPWLLAAAAFAILALGLWGWLGHRAAAELRQPRLEVASVDLAPVGSDQERGTGSEPALDLRAGATLYLALPGDRDPGELEVALNEAGGGTLWARTGARRDPVLRNLTLHLPPRSLPPGRYQIQISAAGGGPIVASYPIEVR